MRKRLLSLAMALAMICGFAGLLPASVATAYNGGGIYNNGLGGIYINIYGPIYTDSIWRATGGAPYGTGGCTWFVGARVRERTGKSTQCWNCSDWYTWYGKSLGFTADKTPSDNCVIVWTGHVAILEKIVGNTAYISEGGVNISSYSNNDYCRIKQVNLSEIPNNSYNGTFLGYVHFGSNTGTIPEWAYISLPKYQFHVGEDIPFYFTSDITTDFTLGVFDSNGVEVYGKNIHGNSANVIINKPGHYHAFVNAYGTGGVTDSGTIYFNVRDPADLGDCFYANIINSAIAKYVTNVNSNAALYSANGENNQIWLFRKQANGSYTIESYGTGKFLDDANYGNTNGANVGIAVKSGEDNVAQQWNVYSDTTSYDTVTYRIATLCGDLMLNVDGGLSDDGTNINLYSDLNNYPQNFTIRKLCDEDENIHTYDDWEITDEPTCTNYGVKTHKCIYCGNVETKNIDALGHDYVETVVAPTCDEQGYTLHKCSRCGDSYKDNYTSKTTHKWSKWTTTKAATCAATGIKTHYCTVCGKYETSTIAKTNNHKFTNWTTTKKATCTANGTQTRKCSVCGKTETKTIKATGHKLTATPAKAATCTTNGNKAYWYCSTCKKYFSAKGGKTAITKASTVIKATGHKFSDWTTTSFNVDKGTSTQKHTCSVCKKPETRTVKNAVVRYAGANRYDTAAMLSKASHKTTSDTVIIADAMTFQDALIAVPLAKAYNAPLLLANPNIVTKQTKAELARLKAKKVIIVNTNKALKKGTLDALKKKYTTQIISGNNCFETSKRVAEELQKKTKKAPTDVFFTTNKAFADALSISPVAALKGAPILYVDPTKKTLDSNILAYLNKVKGSIKNVYIVGGKVAVPAAIENSIKKALPKKNVKRFDGAQRYETCVMINKYFAKDLSSKTVCIAKGLDFPDALAGGVFAANQKAPLLLADTALRDAQKSFLKNKKPNKLYIFGGKVAVPDKLAKEVAKMSV